MIDNTPLEDAYAEGSSVFKEGKSLYDNPYLDKPECEVKSRYFIDGWVAAHAGWPDPRPASKPELLPRFLPFNATFK